jgi:hypothetical protein
VLSAVTGTDNDGKDGELHSWYYCVENMGDKMVGHVAGMRKMRTAHKVLTGKPKG